MCGRVKYRLGENDGPREDGGRRRGKEGKKEGRKEGRKVGRKEGRKEGKKEKKEGKKKGKKGDHFCCLGGVPYGIRRYSTRYVQHGKITHVGTVQHMPGCY